MQDKSYWIALNMVEGIGRITYHKLINYFGTPENVFCASDKELMNVYDIGGKIAHSIKSFKLKENTEEELEKIEKCGCNVYTVNDKEYPPNLRAIPDPPPVIYVKGSLIKDDTIAVAIVGSRMPTTYGKLTAENISNKLAKMGVTIVSGMARGIDSIAHKSAIASKGRTIAVLGCGLNVIYPPENFKLMNEITGHGAVISEFPMSAKPNKMNFPQRNRAISGLSLGTVVIEAAENSGSLITAMHALEQGREVFAVPGNINSAKSRGTNCLIKRGAKLVEDAEDIIEEFPDEVRSYLKPIEKPKGEDDTLPSDEKLIFSLIDDESIHIDRIIEQSNLPAGVVSGILVKLELKGLIKQLSGKMFVRC